MAIRSLSYASAAHQEDMAYLVTCLKADPLAAEYAPEVNSARAAVRAQNDDWNLHRQAVKDAGARVRHANQCLGNAVRSARSTILDSVHYNRNTPAFVTHFPLGLAAFTRTPHDDRVTAVRALARQCALDPSRTIQDRSGVLHAAADDLVSALDRRSDARVAESESYGRLLVEKLHAVQTCRKVSHRLAELYPGEWDKVRSYFRQSYRRSRAMSPCTEGYGSTSVATHSQAGLTAASGPGLRWSSAGFRSVFTRERGW